MKLWSLFLITTMVTAIGEWILLYKVGNTFMHSADLYTLFLNVIGLQAVGFDYGVGFNGPAWYLSVLSLCYIVLYFIVKKSLNRKGNLITGLLIAVALYRCNLDIPFLTWLSCRGYIGFFLGGLLVYIKNEYEDEKIKKFSFGIVLFIGLICSIFSSNIGIIGIIGDINLFFMLVLWPMLFMFIMTSKLCATFLSIKPFIWLGEVWYSVYLWHFPIEVFMIIYNYSMDFILDFSKYEVWIARIIITFVIAILSHYILEPNINNRIKNISLQRRIY